MSNSLFVYYSAALDEIWRLRCILAYEARVVEAHTSLKTFPKSRRAYAEKQIEHMRAAARGKSKDVYAGLDQRAVLSALKTAGADQGLSAPQFQESLLGDTSSDV